MKKLFLFLAICIFAISLHSCSIGKSVSKFVVVSVEKSDKNFEYAKYKIRVTDKSSIKDDFFWFTDTVGKFNIGDNIYLHKYNVY